MADQGDTVKKRNPKPKPVLLTERRIRNYLMKVHEVGKQRSAEHGEKFSPADFAAGAGVVLAYIKRLDLVPAMWFFGMHLGNKNPFAEETP